MPRLAISASTARTVEFDGRELVHFGGCGYLGLAHHPRVVGAFVSAVGRVGISAGASRETTGGFAAHETLEQSLAKHLGAPAALTEVSGYQANLVAAQAFAARCSIALIDDASHTSLFDAARAAELEVRAWPHGDLRALQEELERCTSCGVVVASDSVFPSRGEIARAAVIAALAAARGADAWFDDCHGTGVIGARGRGVLEHAGLSGESVFITSTLSKSLGCSGGFLAGPREWIEAARERSHAHVGATPLAPAVACAALEALDLAFADDSRIRAMRRNAARLRSALCRLELPTPAEDLPVFAFALESAERMAQVHRAMRDEGVFAPYLRYLDSPSEGHFRIVVNAEHSEADVELLARALERALASHPTNSAS